MVKGEIVGSWFNSGYHGHFRSKSRNDFICEYRHLAKPQPPKAFVKKLRLPADAHQFSKHDNRESFQNDAVIFTEGLGKRRFSDRSVTWKPDMLSWYPRRDIGLKGPAHPEYSEYKVTFRGGHRSRPMGQQLVERPKTSFDEDQPPTTSYRYAHGRDNPNRQLLLDAMRNDSLGTTRRPERFQYNAARESVASCMTWVTPQDSRKMCPSRTSLATAPAKTNLAAGPSMAPSPPAAASSASVASVAGSPPAAASASSVSAPPPPAPEPAAL